MCPAICRDAARQKSTGGSNASHSQVEPCTRTGLRKVSTPVTHWWGPQPHRSSLHHPEEQAGTIWDKLLCLQLNTQHQPSACRCPMRTVFPRGAHFSAPQVHAPHMREQGDTAQVMLTFESLFSQKWAFITWSLKTCRLIWTFFLFFNFKNVLNFFKLKKKNKTKTHHHHKHLEQFRHLDPWQFQNPRCICKWNTPSTLKRWGRLQAVRKTLGEEEAPMRTGWKFSEPRDCGVEGSI